LEVETVGEKETKSLLKPDGCHHFKAVDCRFWFIRPAYIAHSFHKPFGTFKPFPISVIIYAPVSGTVRFSDL